MSVNAKKEITLSVRTLKKKKTSPYNKKAYTYCDSEKY